MTDRGKAKFLFLVLGLLAFGVVGFLGQDKTGLPEANADAPLEINVKKFGAKGDAKTDDTLAIQSALDAAGYKSRFEPLGVATTKVVFPTGHYRVTRPLELSHKKAHKTVIIEGMGGVDSFGVDPSGEKRSPRAATQIFYDGDTTGNLIEVLGVGGLQFRNIGLIGNKKADIVLRINSPRGAGGGRYTFHNVVFASANAGVVCGDDSKINSADMTFYDCIFSHLGTAFATKNHQNVDYVFIRPHIGSCNVGMHFEKGGNVYAALPTFIKCGLAIQIDSGGANVGAYCFDALHIEQGEYQILKARGRAAITLTAMSPQVQRARNEHGFDKPMFELDETVQLIIGGSQITNAPIALLKGRAFLQIDNCIIGGAAPDGIPLDPRSPKSVIVASATAGYQIRNCHYGDDFITEFSRFPKQNEK